MKVRISILVVAASLGMALAQDTTKPADTKAPDAKTMDTKTTAAPAEMKTTTYKGVLIDMSCASHASTAAPSDAAQSTDSNAANRAAKDSDSSCPVTASSSEFGMKLDGGQTVRFDIVGNQRAQDAVKNQKSWNKTLTANKPIHATVSGVLNGDKLIVSSIH